MTGSWSGCCSRFRGEQVKVCPTLGVPVMVGGVMSPGPSLVRHADAQSCVLLVGVDNGGVAAPAGGAGVDLGRDRVPLLMAREAQDGAVAATGWA